MREHRLRGIDRVAAAAAGTVVSAWLLIDA